MSGSSINANLRKKIEQKVSARSISDVRNYYPPFITSSLSFKFFPAIRYIVPIVQLFPSIRYFHFFPFVSTLPSGSFTFSFRFTRCSSRYVLPFVSTRTSRSFTYSFRCNSSISSVTSFLWFPLACIPFVYLFFRFKSLIRLGPPIRFNSLTLTSRSFTCLLRCCNSSISFATSFLWFQLLHFVRCFFPFLLTLSFGSLCHSFRFNSSLPFVASFLPFQLLHCVPWQSWMRLAGKIVRGTAAQTGICNPSGHLWPLAATLRPLALKITCGHSSGCKWLRVAAFLNFKCRAFCDLNELYCIVYIRKKVSISTSTCYVRQKEWWDCCPVSHSPLVPMAGA